MECWVGNSSHDVVRKLLIINATKMEEQEASCSRGHKHLGGVIACSDMWRKPRARLGSLARAASDTLPSLHNLHPLLWLRGTLAEMESCDQGEDGQPSNITDANLLHQLRGTMAKYEKRKTGGARFHVTWGRVISPQEITTPSHP